MKKASQGFLKAVATRGVIAAIPVAMASAYASNLFVPVPPRMAAYEYQQVAEITVSPTTVGIAGSHLYGQTKAQIDQQLSEMQALGVQNIRVFVPWGLVDFFGPSEPGSAQWALLDTVMQSAKEHDMGVLAEVDSTPPYAVTAGIPGGGTPDPAKFAAFMTKFVTKYGDMVSAYEIWNEPNGILSSNPINPAAYAALVKAAYQAIKPLDPTATVVAGAVGHVISVGNLTMDPVDFVKAMIAADPTIGQYFDAMSYHPYDNGLPFSQGNLDPNSAWYASDTAFNQIKDLVKLFPDKKMWITEFGLATYTYTDANGVIHTVTQDQQEKYIADLINNWAASFGQNAGPIFLYTGRDTLTGSPDPEQNYGLWNLLGQPKEVITDFLLQWFKDHPQNTTVPTNPGQPTPVTNPLAAVLAAITQQFQAFAAQFQASVAAFVQAVANFFSSFGGPPAVTTSAPLSLRVASVATSETPGAGVDDVSEADTIAKGSEGAEGSEDSEGAAQPEKSTATDVEATPKPDVAEVETTPAVTEPVVETVEPVAAEPVVTETPEDTKTPEPAPSSSTEPAASNPAESGASDTPAKPEKTDPSSKPEKADTATKPEKTNASSKPDKADKPDKTDASSKPDKTDTKDSSTSKDKSDKDTTANKVTPKTSSAGAGADKGSDAKGASHSPSGSGSSGGGDEG